MEKLARPAWNDYYLNIALAVAQRGTCLRRRFGAIIIKDETIVSTGYVGSPRGEPNCIDLGNCYREQYNIPAGQRYELCRSVHAEQNVIINAARSGTKIKDGVMYLIGQDLKQPEQPIIKAMPCNLCRREIVNVGLETVITKDSNGNIYHFKVDDWVIEAKKNPDHNLQLYGIKPDETHK